MMPEMASLSPISANAFVKLSVLKISARIKMKQKFLSSEVQNYITVKLFWGRESPT